MFLQELQSKDVINVVDGTKLGKIIDMEIDNSSGKILNIKVGTNLRFISLFSGSNVILLNWNQIVKVGDEVIIVNCPEIGK